MVLFEKKVGVGEFDIVRDGNEEIMKINYENYNRTPSVEDDENCMASTLDKLTQSPGVTRIIFNQRRTYSYDYDQTLILKEIANIFNYLIKQKKALSFGSDVLSAESLTYFPSRQQELQYLISDLFKKDPVGMYVEVKRILREQKIRLSKMKIKDHVKCQQYYIDLLEEILKLMDKTKLINTAKPYLDGLTIGDRSVYRLIFRPSITPDFIYTRLISTPPLTGQELDAYNIDEDTEVMIFRTPGDVKNLYHLIPPEFKLDEDQYELLDLARNVLASHKPKAEEFIDPERMRTNFFNIGKDLITELAQHKGFDLDYDEIENLARILVRYTVGFGLIEVLLKDEKVQDITVNGPIGETPIFIVHQDFGDCVTNIIPSQEDGLSWATKFRLLSGRPLDEANPVLDTELIVPNARARVAVISSPLNPEGLGYALRRHRDKPWTLPLFINNKMLTPLAAGLISFLIDGSRTFLVAGTRSSGKTSLLASLITEIMGRYRIVTMEDTLEIPVKAFRDLGYNIQPMKVRSALTTGGTELAAEEGIRTSLRLGDSCLIVGEVRSVEAKALYEAMRIGALANVVAGTIHGADPYGVFDRVVNDLGVPRTSFKATDIIIVANPIKTADGLHSVRRVTQITEVRKHWENDPLRENGFVDLMKYDPKLDQLVPTEDLINGETEIIKSIAGNIREFAGNWDAVWSNIQLRADIKETLVSYANKAERLDLLEADFVVKSNDQFHRISDMVREETGSLDSSRIFLEWQDWLKRELRKNIIKV